MVFLVTLEILIHFFLFFLQCAAARAAKRDCGGDGELSERAARTRHRRALSVR